MKTKLLLFFVIAMLYVKKTFSQIVYNNDSLGIKIEYSSRILVTKISDLDIKVTYTAKLDRGVNCYDYLNAAGRSTFGNCYFVLWQLDSSANYRDITLDAINPGHPPEDFDDEADILNYDIARSMLYRDQTRSMSINLFDYVPGLTKGEYLMIFFLRAGNNYGFDYNGKLKRNSLIYLESTPIIFEVVEKLSRLPSYR